MKSFKGWFSELHYATKWGIVGTLAAIFLFTLGYCCGAFTNIATVVDKPGAAVQSVQPSQTQTPAPTQAPTQTPSQSEPSSSDDTTVPTGDSSSQPEDNQGASSGEKTKAEIVALFNESANKIKTNAKSVTRNYEDLQHNEEHLVLPSAVQAIGSGLINQFLKKNETPVVYGSQADIIANYPVKTQNFVSNATEADIAEATCTDDGTYYNVTLKFNECTDPEGNGTASAFNIILREEVMEAAKVVQNFSIKYYDATIVCKIDKATGNMVSATYTLPMIMDVTAKVLISVDATIGMTFIDDYTIEY